MLQQECPWWSSSYDDHLDSERLESNLTFRHRFFSDRVTSMSESIVHFHSMDT